MTTKDVIKMLYVAATLVLIFSPVATATPPNSQTADWPMFQRNAAHVGYSSDNISPTPELLWSRDFGSYVRGFAVYSSGTVYVGDNVRIVSSDPTKCKQGHSGGGVFRALDPMTGETRWELSCVKGDNIGIYTGHTTPVYANGVIYFGDNYGVITAARDKGDHGEVLWQRDLGSAVNGSPIVAEGILYVPISREGVFALDPEIGTILWSLDFKVGEIIETSPAYAAGVLYIAVGESGGYGTLRALNASTGEELWRVRLNYYTTESTPTVSQGKVYIGDPTGQVYSIDAKTGELAWTRQVNGKVNTSAAVAGDIIIFGDNGPRDTYDPELVAFDRSGNQLWVTPVDSYGSQSGSPIIIGNYAAVTTYFSRVKLIDVQTGVIVWESFRFDSGTAATTPVWTGDMLLVGGSNGSTLGWSLPVSGTVAIAQIYLPPVVKQ